MLKLIKFILIGFAGLFLVSLCVVSLADQGSENQGSQATQERTGPPPVVVADITFNEIDQLFGDDSNMTDLQKDEAWKDYEGKCVEWEGELTYMDDGVLGRNLCRV